MCGEELTAVDGEDWVVRFKDGRYLHASPSEGGGFVAVRVRPACCATRFGRPQAQALAAAYWAVTGDGGVGIERAE